ncbi:MAG TPA: hypothetical protein VMT20_12770 [Terriglobia bacterium]|nr:hypothetical protein [Terriglobia bacterium]
MAIMHKGTSPATLEANRANSLKSTGPVTEQGLLVSRGNALQHWGRAETIRPLLAALEENPEEFNRVREALYRSLAPRDEFEQIIVDDMADVHWRIRRMVRAEAGAQGARRRDRKMRDEEVEALFEAGKFHDLVPSIVPKLGYVGLSDSPVKFRRILEMLRVLADLVRYAGFRDEVMGYLQKLYGYNPSERAKSLMDVYDRGYQERDCGDADRIAANHAEFLEAIADEITWFESREASHLQARAELKVPSLDAEMLRTDHNPATVAIYHERLERVFAEKWRLLKEYRATRAANERQDEQQGQGGPPAGDGPQPHALAAG